jgi:hypothetical protein
VLIETADRPAKWDENQGGAGILNIPAAIEAARNL